MSADTRINSAASGTVITDAETIAKLSVAELCESLLQQIKQVYSQQAPVIVGIHRGGFYIAECLQQALATTEAVGALDISWHRDDLRASSVSPHVKPTRLPLDIDGREVLLVDDVLHTGRTIRAALNELFDYGRPAAVRLAVLGQRQGRQLPISADFAAFEFELPPQQQLKLSSSAGSQPLALSEWRLLCVNKESASDE